MSRIPIAAAAPAAGPAYRAAMLRGATVAPPAAAPKRPRAARPKAAPIARKAGPPRRASLNRPTRRVGAARRTVVAATPRVAPVRAAPMPMAAAARELATPLSYALISTIICEIGPPPVVPPGGEIEPGTTPDEGLVVFPPELLQPDVEVVFPPGPGPFPEDRVIILTPERPLKPQWEPPRTLVPVAIPEPTSWALMILGFGLIGARLRAISSAGSGSPGRAGRTE